MGETDGGPAFAGPYSQHDDSTCMESEYHEQRGMSVRQYAEVHFTAAWIQALNIEYDLSDNQLLYRASLMGRAQADAMLEARNEQE